MCRSELMFEGISRFQFAISLTFRTFLIIAALCSGFAQGSNNLDGASSTKTQSDPNAATNAPALLQNLVITNVPEGSSEKKEEGVKGTERRPKEDFLPRLE